MEIQHKIKASIRDVPDFPKKGVIFKDITPILQDADLCSEIADAFVAQLEDVEIDVIVGVESRGFLFGMLLAQRLKKPFVPVRKQGKLPFHTVQQSYDLEYGTATIEIHTDAIRQGQKVLVHDDLLATGGTISAVSDLVEKLRGEIVGYAFLVELAFLNPRPRLNKHSDKIISLVSYQ